MLRHFIDLLDGEVQAVYAANGLEYRPRFTPVVRILVDGLPHTIREIAQNARITHSAASQTVSEMVRLGLATSTRSHSDGRERLIALTPKAQAMLPDLRRIWEATGKATEALGKELGRDLEAETERAIDALGRQSFRQRIADQLKAADG